jgi:hypothetical protein
MASDLEKAGIALGTGVAVATTHGLAHMEFGDAESFDEAGVTEVGATVAVASTAATGGALVLDDALD